MHFSQFCIWYAAIFLVSFTYGMQVGYAVCILANFAYGMKYLSSMHFSQICIRYAVCKRYAF